jgi:hypothetical protein
MPSENTDDQMREVRVSLTPAEHDALQRAAARDERSLTGQVRFLVKRAVAQELAQTAASDQVAA